MHARTEAAEHDLVIKQLEPMDKGRRCYRMIGDVLVERTVAETLPAGACASAWVLWGVAGRLHVSAALGPLRVS
jgi:hypothetical protein